MVDFIGKFNVVPSLPEKLEPLREIVNNLYWTWNQDAIELFRRLDIKLWDAVHHNPVLMLGKLNQERLFEAAMDDSFISHMKRVHSQMGVYLKEKAWYQKNFNYGKENVIAYFSAEFGLTESLIDRVYADLFRRFGSSIRRSYEICQRFRSAACRCRIML